MYAEGNFISKLPSALYGFRFYPADEGSGFERLLNFYHTTWHHNNMS